MMRPLEDAGKNGWPVAYLHVIMTCDTLTSVHHNHSQTANRAKFRLVPTDTPSTTRTYTPSSQITVVLTRSGWNHADWGCIVYKDDSRFQLCPGNHRRRVWRRPGQRVNHAFTVAHNSDPQPGVMVWGAISFDSRTTLVVIKGKLTAQRYVDDIVRTVLLPLICSTLALFFSDNAKPHTARVATNCLTACQALP
ncbi:transposable element Tc1 transposase [Trichonephila clavipes]|nr:transposable element Tc1 transposase [Trichonephila clavipes]